MTVDLFPFFSDKRPRKTFGRFICYFQESSERGSRKVF